MAEGDCSEANGKHGESPRVYCDPPGVVPIKGAAQEEQAAFPIPGMTMKATRELDLGIHLLVE